MLGQKLGIEKTCVHSRGGGGHCFDPKFMKHRQNVDPNKIKVKITTGSCCEERRGTK